MIEYLAARPEFIPALAEKLLAHWGPIIPGQTLEGRVAKLRGHLNRDVLPIAWVALEGDALIGTAALRAHDLEGREDLTPWLGGVFVLEEHRKQGIGALLCERVEAEARALGYNQIYLFATDRVAWYRSLGWDLVERITWNGFPGAIMRRSLG